MYGYVLQKPTGLPETKWACKTVVTDYEWENCNSQNMIEFGICKADARVICIGDRAPISVGGTTLSCLIGNTKMSSHAETGTAVEIASIAVCFDRLSFEEREIEESDCRNKDLLLIPLYCEHLSEREANELASLFHQYIHAYIHADASSELLRWSIVFDLLSRLDGLARRESVMKKGNYIHYYVKKADSIIATRYGERLTVKKVADELDITPNYLSKIYKESMGVGFSDRLYEVRIREAKRLLLSENLCGGEIAERVGLDESNLRKRFKQYFGVCMREYRSIAKEQTLYHDRPTRKTD